MDETINTRVVVAELIGTAVLVMGGPGSAILAGQHIGIFGVAVAFGVSLAIMAYVIGPVSGCHINPAVTLGMFLKRRIDRAHAIGAWVGQVVGGLVGALVIFVIVKATDDLDTGTFAANQFGADNGFASAWSAILVEIVFTALLVFVVFATTSRKFPAVMGGVIAGATLTLIHLVTIPIDNTSVNPARSIATAILAESPDGGTHPAAQLWLFIIFPLIGGALGAFLWDVVEPEPDDAPAYDAEGMSSADHRDA
jgi:aquaporin Z